ncbi:hypothetical protein L211DRAFT_833187 [Terfezia boudieri ATCC MYA-4762]|uniref:Uncharacterized protein n=1 Tax=Terfezia boudieri ATCC MYA-4762 TaxID=1051890 RepID=A0A3N4LZH1_9PEZI|nr:hypothetical protein L211DRAFT_833187 [Terfezia boudieri ATCC MYA-4762]
MPSPFINIHFYKTPGTNFSFVTVSGIIYVKTTSAVPVYFFIPNGVVQKRDKKRNTTYHFH